MTQSSSSSQVHGKGASSTASRKSDGESKSKDQGTGSVQRIETGNHVHHFSQHTSRYFGFPKIKTCKFFRYPVFGMVSPGRIEIAKM